MARRHPAEETCTPASPPSAALPVAEGRQETLLCVIGDRFLAQGTCECDRRAHLLEVRRAAVAEDEVLLEPVTVFGRHRALEVVGHELDELSTGQVFFDQHRSVLREVVLERLSDLRARPVQEYPLISLGKVQSATNLFR